MTIASEPATARTEPARLDPGQPLTPLRRWTPVSAFKAVLILAPCIVLWPLQMAVLRFRPSAGDVLPHVFHRWVLRIIGVRVIVHGKAPAPDEPVLIVANHVSWLDIPIIGAVHHVVFVAKSEISGWPIIGLCARLQRSIFIDRSRKTATVSANAAMSARLVAQGAVVLFAEGTTGDGTRVRPFRSSLLGAVQHAMATEGAQIPTVRPLALIFLGRSGIPGGRAGRARLAWSGDTALLPHLQEILGGGPIDVALVWCDPVDLPAGTNRKLVAAAAEAAIRSATRRVITGREQKAAGPDAHDTGFA